MANMHQLLKTMIDKGASDLHITTGTAPQLRIDGKLHPLKMEALTPQETKQLCYSVLTDSQKHKFEEDNELDLSFGVQKLSRFRANVFVQRGNVAGAFRADQDLRGPSGMLLGVPIPSEDALDAEVTRGAISQAVERAHAAGIVGKAMTPYLLSTIFEVTNGASLKANVALIKNNARVGTEVAHAVQASR